MLKFCLVLLLIVFFFVFSYMRTIFLTKKLFRHTTPGETVILYACTHVRIISIHPYKIKGLLGSITSTPLYPRQRLPLPI